VKPWFEGGQMPLSRRVPKLKGFTNPFRVEYAVVNLDTIAAFEGDEIDPDALRARGLVQKQGLVKVLGRGQLDRPVRVAAHAFSRSAEAAITAAGGTVEVLPPPFGHGRPPAAGNALTNR
jgi:large subunit ribosomal protein L15